MNSYLHVKKSVFDENILIEDCFNPHAGIISSSVGGTIDIDHTTFLNNQMSTYTFDSAMGAVIYSVQDSNITIHTNLHIS